MGRVPLTFSPGPRIFRMSLVFDPAHRQKVPPDPQGRWAGRTGSTFESVFAGSPFPLRGNGDAGEGPEERHCMSRALFSTRR